MNNNNNNKVVNYHIWDGEDIKAQVFGNVELPDGSSIHGKLGETVIKKGDAVYLDYGSNKMVYTRSGKGFESEFPFGKISLHECPVSVVLSSGENTFVKFTTSDNNDFLLLVEKQKERIQKIIPDLKDAFIFKEVELRQKNKLAKQEADKNVKSLLSGALSQMESFSNRLKP